MKSKSILIAYQDDLWARSLSTFFHGIGYKVETAKMVSEMIRKVRKGNIHVVLLDDEIEGVKACDLVPLFKKMDDKIQVIVISSDLSLGLVKRLRGAGIFYQAMKRLDEKDLWPWYPLLDIWMFIYYLIFAPALFKKPKVVWK